MLKRILFTQIITERDVVAARQRARQISALLGFAVQDQTRVATAVSEIARNALMYARSGTVEFVMDLGSPQSLVIHISDRGPGIKDLSAVLNGKEDLIGGTEAKFGIVSAKRLMDAFDIQSSLGSGTHIQLRKDLPKHAAILTARDLAKISAELARQVPDNLLDEVKQQNRELLQNLEELSRREKELRQLNSELEETNRGIIALYAELDEKAEHLRHAHELKTRFVSHVGHEFRTPLNSILGLSRILLDRLDGPLSNEQEKQVLLIRKAAEDSLEMVNDLLDLARIEAGKAPVRLEEFTVQDLFGTLRGMLKPLLTESVALLFDAPETLPPLFTDKGKVAQVLRNFLTNALKFTERGRVRIWAERIDADDQMMFSVEDTGIGIAPEDHARIFEEFTQLDNQLQGKAKGSGLGLPVSKKLAELLCGSVSVQSVPGKGSTFSLTLPRSFPPSPSETVVSSEPPAISSSGRVLVVDDDETSRYVLRHMVPPGYDVIEAATGLDGLQRAKQEHPTVIFLDLIMPEVSGFHTLEQLGRDPVSRDIPVVIYTSKVLDAVERDQLASAAAVLSKAQTTRDTVSATILEVTRQRTTTHGSG
jgi:signal transduction histidine kinase/ActR/RegA family two-component response regulator